MEKYITQWYPETGAYKPRLHVVPNVHRKVVYVDPDTCKHANAI